MAMKKHLAILTFILALSVFVLTGTSYFGTVQAATDVSGLISSDTTWTVAGSPYSLTGPVGVSEGVTLIIEAGVTVNLNSYYLQVNGTLYARGSSTEPIYINDGSEGTDGNGYPIDPITFTPLSSDWNEQTSTGCIIENAVLSSTSINVISSPRLCNNLFTECVLWVSTTWSGSGWNHYDASPMISNNTFNGNGLSYGIIVGYSSANISQNTISGYSTGITLNSDTSTVVQGNCIVDNGIGIQVNVHQGSSSPVIENNTITNNSYGISIVRQFDAPNSPTIKYNNIFANTNYNINSEIPDEINATYNWWGTTDTQVINQTMHDFYDDFTLGTVTFVPFLTEANPDAPLVPEFASPLIISILLASILVASLFFKRNAGTKKVKLQTSSAGVICFKKLKH